MKKKTYKLMPSGEGTIFRNLFSESVSLPILPLTFKSDCYRAWKMLEKGRIPVIYCDVFDESLSYFFYGRADYEVITTKDYNDNYLFYPVCFLIDPDFVEIDAIFPFDTGAYREGFYKDYIHPEMDINDFSIKPTLKHIMGYINYFFGDNRAYCYARKDKVNKYEISLENQDELNALLSLLQANGANKFDSRSCAIEIISRKSLILFSGIKAVILPEDYLYAESRKSVINKMKDAGVELITYDVMGLGARAQNTLMKEKVLAYLKNKNLL